MNVQVSDPPMTSDSTREVMQQVQRTENNVVDLEAIIEALQDRLEPVVNHKPLMEGCTPEGDRAALAPLAERLSRTNDRIERAIANLSYSLSVIQI